jgi:hypothetical protein
MGVNRMKKLITTLAVALTAMAALAGPTLAANPTTQQYSNSLTGAQNSAGGNSGGTHNDPGTGASVASESGGGGGGLGSLPFTGTDLIALGAIALCLMATGLLLQQLTSPRRD